MDGDPPPNRRRALPAELRCLAKSHTRAQLAQTAARARRLGAGAHVEALASGLTTADAYGRALADWTGARFADTLRIARAPDAQGGRDARDLAALGLANAGSAERPDLAISLGSPHLPRTVAALRARPAAAGRVVFVAPQTFTDALVAANGGALAAQASRTVERVDPELSARQGLSGWQRSVVAGAVTAAVAGLALMPLATLVVLLAVLSAFFLAITALRLAAAAATLTGHGRPPPPRLADAELPVYTVLVAMYREAKMAAPLMEALSRIDYPAAKLDGRLVIEADDEETRAALARIELPPWCQVVTVPPGEPRTKPRALDFALALARGELVAVFDAEDRPEAGQLRRAANAFAALPDEVACLQGRLAWYNWTDNGLTRQFAIEYASLFDVLLPGLDRLGLPIPLGGTSNHFRVAALRHVGGWDAWNVTEDADVGFRLHRFGYRCGTIDTSTYEEAPNTFGAWMRQRTRWLKGWMQTYAVHMRAPRRLWRELGPAGFLTFQALVGGVVMSALVHPAFVAVLAGHVLGGDAFLGDTDPAGVVLRTLGAVNLGLGYAAGFALGLIGLYNRPMRHLAWEVALLPFYWLLMSLAAYRALWQVAVDPFGWEKTTHGLAAGIAPPPVLARRRGRG